MKILLFLLIAVSFLSACSHNYYIVRHAEKETPSANMSNDVHLSDKGKARAEALKEFGQRLPVSPTHLSLALGGQVLVQAFLRLLSPGAKDRRFNPLSSPSSDVVRALMQLVEVSYLSNQRLHSFYYALRVLNLAEGREASPERARAEANFCLGAGMLGWQRLAGFYFERARDSVQRGDDALVRAYVFQVTGIYELGLGRWDSAQQALKFAAEIYKQLGYQRQWGECLMPQTVIASAQGQIGPTEDLLNTLLSASLESGDLLQQGWARAGQAHLDLLTGQVEAALTVLQIYLDICKQVSHGPGMITAYGLMAMAYLRQKETLLARQAADAGAQYIRRSTHTVFTNTEGYSAVLETYLGLLEICPDAKSWEYKTLLSQIKDVLKAMQVQTRSVPAGLARYLLLRGDYRWLTGAHAQAFKDWHRSLEDAQRLKMP